LLSIVTKNGGDAPADGTPTFSLTWHRGWERGSLIAALTLVEFLIWKGLLRGLAQDGGHALAEGAPRPCGIASCWVRKTLDDFLLAVRLLPGLADSSAEALA